MLQQQWHRLNLQEYGSASAAPEFDTFILGRGGLARRRAWTLENRHHFSREISRELSEGR